MRSHIELMKERGFHELVNVSFFYVISPNRSFIFSISVPILFNERMHSPHRQTVSMPQPCQNMFALGTSHLEGRFCHGILAIFKHAHNKYWVQFLNVFYFRRAQRDSAEKISENGLNMNQRRAKNLKKIATDYLRKELS